MLANMIHLRNFVMNPHCLLLSMTRCNISAGSQVLLFKRGKQENNMDYVFWDRFMSASNVILDRNRMSMEFLDIAKSINDFLFGES